MKRIVALLVVVLMLVLSLAACGGIPSDPEKLEAKFKDMGVEDVMIVSDNEDIEDALGSLGVKIDAVEYVAVAELDDPYEDGSVTIVSCSESEIADAMEKAFKVQVAAQAIFMKDYVVEREGDIVFCGPASFWEDFN